MAPISILLPYSSSIIVGLFFDTSKMLFVHDVCFMSEMQNRKAFPSTIKNLLVFEDSQKAKAFLGLQKSMISDSAQNSGILTCSEMHDINSISDISPEFLTSLFPAGKFQIMESTASSLVFLINLHFA